MISDTRPEVDGSCQTLTWAGLGVGELGLCGTKEMLCGCGLLPGGAGSTGPGIFCAAARAQARGSAEHHRLSRLGEHNLLRVT